MSPQLIDFDRYVTLAHAAEEAGCSNQRVAFLAATGRIRYVTTPLGRLYDLEDCRKRAELRATRAVAPSSDEGRERSRGVVVG